MRKGEKGFPQRAGTKRQTSYAAYRSRAGVENGMLSIKTQTGARISNGNRSVLGVLHLICPELRKSQTARLSLKEKLCRLTLKERGKEKKERHTTSVICLSFSALLNTKRLVF